MTVAVEIARAPLKPHCDVTLPNSYGHNTICKAFQIIRPWAGCRNIWWGNQVENPEYLRLFVEWESIEAHKSARQDPAYLPAVDPIVEVVAGPHTEYHALLQPSSPSVLGEATITAVVSCFFENQQISGFKSSFQHQAQTSLARYSDIPRSTPSISAGWVHEEQPIPGEERNGCLFMAFIGRMPFDNRLGPEEIDQLKRELKSVPGADQLLQVEVVHVRCKKFTVD